MIDSRRRRHSSPLKSSLSSFFPSTSPVPQVALLPLAVVTLALTSALPVVARPSAHSALSDREFCTLENFQNCLNVDFFQSPTAPSSRSPPVAKDRNSTVRSKNKQSSSSVTSLVFPTTLAELEVTCRDLKERVKCLDEHSERCFSPQMMRIFGHIVTNAKQFVYDLCDNRHIQNQFLVHAECFRNISLDEQKCGLEYRDSLSVEGRLDGASSSVGRVGRDTAQDKEHFMRRSCCVLQELVMCKRRHVREQCGESAAIFMRDHLPRITNPVLEQHCSAFTYTPGACDEALHRRRVIDGQLVQLQPVMFQQQQNRQQNKAKSDSTRQKTASNSAPDSHWLTAFYLFSLLLSTFALAFP